jgi:hypothetical protein
LCSRRWDDTWEKNRRERAKRRLDGLGLEGLRVHCAAPSSPAVRAQGFRNKGEVQRFADMMEELCHLVATKHSGSLKAEHGTGACV